MTQGPSGQRDRGPSRRRRTLRQLVWRRMAFSLPIMILVSVGVFALAAISPLDPLDAYLAGQSASLTEAQQLELRQRLGLDQLWWQAWLDWVGGLFTGDLGDSLAYRQQVGQVIGDRLPYTLLLGAAGLIVAVIIAVSTGVAAAMRPGSVIDRTVSALANLLQSVPPFILGLVTIAVYAVGLRVLPTGGLTDPGDAVTAASLARHLVLPTLVFACSQVPWLILGLRETLIRTLQSDPVIFARLRGISRPTILLRHVLPVAAPPFVALLATRLPELIGGSVIVETIFAWPGLGSATVEAVTRLDLGLMAVLTLGTTALVLIFTLLADLYYVVSDPRVEADV